MPGGNKSSYISRQICTDFALLVSLSMYCLCLPTNVEWLKKSKGNSFNILCYPIGAIFIDLHQASRLGEGLLKNGLLFQVFTR